MKKGTIQQTLAVSIEQCYDVVVVGGGIAGCAAALAAAREGSKTLLLEKMTMLGGLATAGHIVIYLPLCDGYGRQVIGGIGEELLHLSIRDSYRDNVETWKEEGRRYETRFNGPSFALALEELLRRENVDILYDMLAVTPVVEDGWCNAVMVESKSGRHGFGCGAVVDATGDAELFARAGENCENTPNNLAIWCYCTQGGTGHILKRGGAAEHNLHLLTLGNIDKSKHTDEVRKPYFGDSAREINRFIHDGHKRLLDLVKEDRDLVLASLPSMAQIRMARRIEGIYTLTEEDLGKHFADNIGASGDWRRPNPIYEIPYRTLYTEGLKNVFAAGRCISSAGVAWEVLRVIPPAAVTGQAAGIAASMVQEAKIPAAHLPVTALRERLKAAGAWLDANKEETT